MKKLLSTALCGAIVGVCGCVTFFDSPPGVMNGTSRGDAGDAMWPATAEVSESDYGRIEGSGIWGDLTLHRVAAQ